MRGALSHLVALAALAAPAPAQEDAFKALEKGFLPEVSARMDAASRVRLVALVAGYDNPAGAKLLVAGLAALVDRVDRDYEAFQELRKQYAEVNVVADVKKDDYKTRTELQNRLMEEEARQQEDSKVLDAFREAMAKFQDAKAVSSLSADARKLKSWRSREVAAEGIAANPAGTESAIRLAQQEKDERVTAAVLRGLRGRATEPVFAFAKESLKAESWPVRLEAALTLEKVNQPRILIPLIEAMSREDGRLRDDIRDVLRRLTSQNFDAEPDQWRLWYIDNREELEGPGPATALFGAFKSKSPAPEKKSVYGIESRSRKILFIIDSSGSMRERITKAKGTATGLSADELEEMDMTKIDLAKRELKRAIRGLEPEAQFNIIMFASHVVRWKEKMVKGDMATKNEAYAFVRDLEAAGGTWAYGALQEAFTVAGMGALDKYYDPAMDTVYFISDGAPTNNDMNKPEAVDPETVLSAVREWNRLGKVKLHAVAIDPRAAGGRFVDFMKKLAAQNGGQYTQRE